MVRSKRHLAANLMERSGMGAVLRRAPVWSGLLVLNYHRIGEPGETPYDTDLFSARQDAFERQVTYLARNVEIVTPADIPAIRAKGRGRYALLTFDDGYRDNYELGFPVLAAHGVPAAFFICTGFVDEPKLAWWDEIAWMIRHCDLRELPASEWFTTPIPVRPNRLEATRAALRRYKELPGDRTAAFLDFLREATGMRQPNGVADGIWMTWEMIRELRRAGMTIGAHTVRHQLLGRLTDEEQAAEIGSSRDRIAAETGEAPRAFAYPVGSRDAFNVTTKQLLAEHGFEAAFSFYGGLQPFDRFDPYDIRRAHVGCAMTLSEFQAIVTLPEVFAR